MLSSSGAKWSALCAVLMFGGAQGVSEGTVAAIRAQISDLIDETPELLAKFVRLGFHDCVGGCDGCVDMDNEDNGGLEVPIEALANIVDEYAADVSRADIWAMAALEGAYRGQEDNNFLPNASFALGPFVPTYNEFRLDNYGRVDCDGEPMKGPSDRPFPSSISLDLQGVLDYFEEQFGFDENQTVALMGAHTLGFVHSENTDFEDGAWTNNNPFTLTADYYYLLRRAPWLQEEQNVGDLFAYRVPEGIPSSTPHAPDPIHALGNGPPAFIPDVTAERTIMLNPDLALIRDYAGYLDPETGKVSCDFAPVEDPTPNVTACPYAKTIGRVRYYDDDPTLGAEFINDFESVFKLMLEHVGDTGAVFSPVEGRVMTNEEECSFEEVSLGVDPRDTQMAETTIDIYTCGGGENADAMESLVVIACGGGVDKKEYSLLAEKLASDAVVVVVDHAVFLGPTPSNFATAVALSNAVEYAQEKYPSINDATLLGHSYGGVVVLQALTETCDFPWCGAFPGASETVELPSIVTKAAGYGVTLINEGAFVEGTDNFVPSRNATVPYFGYFGQGDSALTSMLGDSTYVEVTYEALHDPKTFAVTEGLDHYSATNRVLGDNGDVLAATSRTYQITTVANAFQTFMDYSEEDSSLCDSLAEVSDCWTTTGEQGSGSGEGGGSKKKKSKSNKLSTGAIVGIVIACIVVLALCALAAAKSSGGSSNEKEQAKEVPAIATRDDAVEDVEKNVVA